MKKDLDQIWLYTREALKNKKDLELEGKFEDISIGQILYEIRCKAEDLVLPDAGRIPVPQYPIARTGRFIVSLKKVDIFLQGWRSYRVYIRPQVKKMIKIDPNKKIVSVKDLLKYQEQKEFIEVIYSSILQRKPDEGARINCQKALRERDTTKIQLIYEIANSEEAKRKNIKVAGLKIFYWYEGIKAKIFSIPVLGSCIRWIIALIFLKRRMDDIYTHIRNMTYYQQKVQEELASTVNTLQEERARFNYFIEEVKKQQRAVSEELIKLNAEFKQAKTQTNIETEKINEKITETVTTVTKIQEIIMESWEEKQKRERKRIKNQERFNQIYVDYKEKLMPITRENAKNERKIYLDYLLKQLEGAERRSLKIIDVGCGKGEWLELLSDAGFFPVGVDNNPKTINQILQANKKINIICQDALEFLQEQGEETADVITSFHMIEHMKSDELFDFLDACKRTLRKGGLLLFATPNPRNLLIATEIFYMDFTHRKPIPMELLEFYLQEWGFHILDKISARPLEYFPMEYKEDDPVSHMAYRFNMEQEYAIWAVKQ